MVKEKKSFKSEAKPSAAPLVGGTKARPAKVVTDRVSGWKKLKK